MLYTPYINIIWHYTKSTENAWKVAGAFLNIDPPLSHSKHDIRTMKGEEI